MPQKTEFFQKTDQEASTKNELSDLMFKLSINSRELTKLDLSMLLPDRKQLLKIFDNLQQNYYLEELILTGKQINRITARALAKALDTNTSLKKLHMTFCKITDEIAAILADGLRANTGIEVINLSCNRIQTKGTEAIAAALHNHKSIQEIYLDGCRIGDDGLESLGMMLEQNQSITKISAVKSGLTAAAIKEFETHVAKHPALKKLDLWGNNLEYVYFDPKRYDVEEMSTKFITADYKRELSMMNQKMLRFSAQNNQSVAIVSTTTNEHSEEPSNQELLRHKISVSY